MNIYLVGGAIRDKLLGIPVVERDWVVVGATEGELERQGFRRVEADFPVFLHPQSGEEYALARIETKTAPGYSGFRVESGSDITLEQDLKRRDLTINALAEDEEGNLTDLFSGRDDLEQRVLRHISPAFIEDPVRLLRLARFAAKLDFSVAAETKTLLQDMVNSGELQALQPERVWREMERALGEEYPWRFFQVLHESGALTLLLPEVAAVLDRGSESIAVLQLVASSSRDPIVRFVVVMWGVVADNGGLEKLCQRLRRCLCADQTRYYCELLELLQRGGMLFRDAAAGRAESILQLIRQSRTTQQAERFHRFSLACSALWPVHEASANLNLELALQAMDRISSQELQQEGFSGAKLGAELERRQLEVIRAALQDR